MLATQAVSRMRDAFGMEISVRSIFEEPTVAGLARRVDAMMTAGEREAAPPLVRVSRDGVGLPLSFAQQRLWFLDQLAPNGSSYNIPGAVSLDGSLDLKALERASTRSSEDTKSSEPGSRRLKASRRKLSRRGSREGSSRDLRVNGLRKRGKKKSAGSPNRKRGPYSIWRVGRCSERRR